MKALILILLLAIAACSSQVCDGVGKEYDECVTRQAVRERSVAPCNTLANESYVYCVKTVAGVTEDLQLCELLEDTPRMECRMDVAVRTSDTGTCLDLGSIYMNNACIQAVALKDQDVEICGLVENIEHEFDTCISFVAVAKDDEDMCKSISTESVRQDCLRVTGQTR